MVEVFHSLARIEKSLESVNTKLEKIMATQADLKAELDSAFTEIQTGITNLQQQIAQGGTITPDLQASADKLKALADSLAPTPAPAPAS